MNWGTDLHTLHRLSWSDRLLLAEATFALGSASVAIRLLPFRRLMTALSTPSGPEPGPSRADADIARVQWAIQACARRLPWRIVCFQKGLALFHMLRRRSIGSVVHYGVALDGGNELKAHVWVTRAGRDLIGGEEARNFACLASFPAENEGTGRLPAA